MNQLLSVVSLFLMMLSLAMAKGAANDHADEVAVYVSTGGFVAVVIVALVLLMWWRSNVKLCSCFWEKSEETPHLSKERKSFFLRYSIYKRTNENEGSANQMLAGDPEAPPSQPSE